MSSIITIVAASPMTAISTCVIYLLLVALHAVAADDRVSVEVDEFGASMRAAARPATDEHQKEQTKKVKKKKEKDAYLDKAIRKHNADIARKQRESWDLPDEQALIDLNLCALCEAVVYDGAKSAKTWMDRENARLAASEKRPSKGSRGSKAPKTSLQLSGLTDALESSCADRTKWKRDYRQTQVNAYSIEPRSDER